MLSLYDYIKGIYEMRPPGAKPPKPDFDRLIDDESKCFELISDRLELDITDSVLNLGYVAHTVITWLLGMGIRKVFKPNNEATDFHKLFGSEIWLRSALLHDYGYFCSETCRKDLPLGEITGKYDLLTDSYDGDFECLSGMSTKPDYECYFSYSYDEIKNYYAFSQSFHDCSESTLKGERGDHGIVGACVAFGKYCERVEANKFLEEDGYSLEEDDISKAIQKIACITAASHNIFKSKNIPEDIIYIKYGLSDLTTTSEPRVKKRNEPLLILALVDTIECTKLYSDRSAFYIPPSTVLKQVDIDVREDGIDVDYGRLYEHIVGEHKNTDKGNELYSHIASVCKLGRWTDLCAEVNDSSPYKVSVRLKNDN